jgi:benzoyl-CoA reductase/2-hydroxyglutaryl-CoA dehydratase subunit BcrC/BadD/HgdB
VSEAESLGLPRTICAWVKGIFSTLLAEPDIAAVIVATQGDCSYTQALGELLEVRAVKVIHFNYPYPKDRHLLDQEIIRLRQCLGVGEDEVNRQAADLVPLRQNLRRLDRLTWETGQVQSRENFLYLISSSDFAGDVTAFARQVGEFLLRAEQRPPRTGRVRLGLVGIPPIFTDLWDYLEELEADVVFNEMPRQFSMPYPNLDLTTQYLRYTYPYDIRGRLADLQEAIATRRLDGLIHYTQSFCFRQMFDQVLREQLNLPILTIEGDRPTALDSRTRLRLEAFVDVLRP